MSYDYNVGGHKSNTGTEKNILVNKLFASDVGKQLLARAVTDPTTRKLLEAHALFLKEGSGYYGSGKSRSVGQELTKATSNPFSKNIAPVDAGKRLDLDSYSIG